MKIKYHLLLQAVLEATVLIGGISLIIGALVGIVLAIIWTASHIGWITLPVWAFVLLIIVFTVVFYIDLHENFIEEQKKIINTLKR